MEMEICSSSFINLQILLQLVFIKLEDIIKILGSIDIIMGELNH